MTVASPANASFVEVKDRLLADVRSRMKVRPRSWHEPYRRMVLAVDTLVIAASLAVVHQVFVGPDSEAHVLGVPMPSVAVTLAIGVMWLVFLDANRTRSRGVVGRGLDEYRRVLNANLHTLGLVALTSYVLAVELPRPFYLTLLPAGLLVLAGRWACRHGLGRLRSLGRAVTPVIVAGAPDAVGAVVADLRRNGHAGYEPVAVSWRAGSGGAVPGSTDLPYVDLDRLNEHVEAMHAGAVVVAPGLPRDQVRALAWSLECSPVELMFVPHLIDVAGPRMTVRQTQGLSLVHVDLPRFGGLNVAVKRCFDIVASAAALVVLAPVLAVVALLIKAQDGGSVIFRQERVGRGGQPFVIHKFRTMVANAATLPAPRREGDDEGSFLAKTGADPRITKLGRFLRATSLDELPQFWTVLKGDMSVVGPRPHLERELAEYPHEGLRRLLIKPGITGLWQVNGRSNLCFADAVRLDLRYVENWSLTGDLVILLKTVRTVLARQGAC